MDSRIDNLKTVKENHLIDNQEYNLNNTNSLLAGFYKKIQNLNIIADMEFEVKDQNLEPVEDKKIQDDNKNDEINKVDNEGDKEIDNIEKIPNEMPHTTENTVKNEDSNVEPAVEGVKPVELELNEIPKQISEPVLESTEPIQSELLENLEEPKPVEDINDSIKTEENAFATPSVENENQLNRELVKILNEITLEVKAENIGEAQIANNGDQATVSPLNDNSVNEIPNGILESNQDFDDKMIKQKFEVICLYFGCQVDLKSIFKFDSLIDLYF